MRTTSDFIEVNLWAHKGYGNPVTLGTAFIRMIQKGPSGCEISTGGGILIVKESYEDVVNALGVARKTKGDRVDRDGP